MTSYGKTVCQYNVVNRNQPRSDCFYHMTFRIGFYRLTSGHILKKIYIGVTDVVDGATYSHKN